jgi:hypothetical protein
VDKLAIEAELLHKLPKLFTVDKRYELSDEQIKKMAAETYEARVERAEVTDKLKVLQTGMATLRKA